MLSVSTQSTIGGVWQGTGVTAIGEFDPTVAGVGTHTITYQTSSTECFARDSINIEVYTGTACLTGINTISDINGISIFPNPVSSNLNITGITDFLITILSTSGQIVLTAKNRNSIDISSLNDGQYFYQINHEGSLLNGEFYKISN